MRVLTACLLTVVAVARTQEIEFAAALQPERMLGCVLVDGAVRLPDPLPTPSGTAPLVVETETPVSVKWQNDDGAATAADDAVGGACVAFVSEAIYHVNITRAGYYWYWQRVWIPRKASWSHTVQIDDRVPMQLRFGNRKEDEADTWFWIGGGERFYLKPGVHTIAVRNLHNGKRLDRFVLTTDADWQPEGDGPATTPIVSVTEGEFLSAPVDPLSVVAWQALEVGRQGAVTVEVNRGDRGFEPLPPDGSLGGNETPLQVRITLRQPDGEAAPAAELGPVRYAADPAAFHILANDAVQMVLHRATGRICGLRDPRTRRRYLPDGLPYTLFTLELKAYGDPEIRTLAADEAKLVDIQGDASKATLNFRFAEPDIRVGLELSLTAEGVVETVLTVANKGTDDIVGVNFPILAETRAGVDGTDDTLCFPSQTGRLVPQPGRAGTLENTHPIRTPIGFCDVSDAQGGVMLAPTDYPMILTHFISAADPGGQSTTLTLSRRDRIKAGRMGSFRAAIGLHPGDWHAAADWYRQWFTARVGRADIPAWVYDSDGWVTRLEPEAMAGLGFTHIQLWRQTGHGACPTYYLPDPAYRSGAEYTAIAREWQELGGHLGVYFHGNAISRSYIQADAIYGIPVAELPADKRPPSWEWFVRNRHRGPERKPVEKMDMSEVDEPADHEEYPSMSWQGGDWDDYLRYWAMDVWLDEYGLDTPYWDTMACRDAQDYNPNYQLNGEGRAAMMRYLFLRDNMMRGRQTHPGFYQLVEGGSELLGLAAGQLESNFVQNLEVGRYTHPDQIYYIGHSNGWWTPPRTHLAVCRAFYLNTKLDLIRLTDNVMQVVRTRRWLAPWLYHSTFKDDLGLTLGHDEVKGALHLHEGERGDALVATFMNWQLIGGVTAEIDVARYLEVTDALRAYSLVQGGEPELLPLTMAAGRATIAVPVSPVSAVLFLADPERAAPVVQARQQAGRKRIRVFDPAGTTRLLWATLTTAEAEFSPAKGDANGRFAVRNDDGKVMFGRDIDYADYDGLQQIRHIDIVLANDSHSLTTRSLVQPLFADPGFEAAEFDDAEAHSGERSLRLDPPNSLRHFPLHFIPGHRYRISLWIKRLENKGNVYANIYEKIPNKHNIFGARPRPGDWVRVETEYTMPNNENQPRLYLYNWQGTTKPAWFDDIHIEDLGPAE